MRYARLPNELQFTCYSSKWIIIHCYCSSELKCKGEKRRLTSGLLLLKMKTLLLKVKTELRAVGAIPLFCSPCCVLFSLLSWLSHCLSPSVLFSLYWFRSSVFFICVRSPLVFRVCLFGGGDGATGDEAGVRVLAGQCFSPFQVFFSSFSCSLCSLFFSFFFLLPLFFLSSVLLFFRPCSSSFFCSPPYSFVSSVSFWRNQRLPHVHSFSFSFLLSVFPPFFPPVIPHLLWLYSQRMPSIWKRLPSFTPATALEEEDEEGD